MGFKNDRVPNTSAGYAEGLGGKEKFRTGRIAEKFRTGRISMVKRLINEAVQEREVSRRKIAQK